MIGSTEREKALADSVLALEHQRAVAQARCDLLQANIDMMTLELMKAAAEIVRLRREKEKCKCSGG